MVRMYVMEGRRWEVANSETLLDRNPNPRTATDRVWISDEVILTPAQAPNAIKITT